MQKQDRPIKVLMLLENHSYQRDSRVQFHARALAANGYQVMVISPGNWQEPFKQTIDGITLYHFPSLQAAVRMSGYFLEFAYGMLMITLLTTWVVLFKGADVISMANPPDSLFVACLLPKLLGKKIIHDLRDPSPELYLAKFGAEKKNTLLFRGLVYLERCACRLADCVITVNESVRKILIARNNLPSDRVIVVRQGPDLDLIRPTAPDQDLRQRAGTIFGYLGNMSKQDGLEHLLYALNHLDAHIGCRDWYCVLIGHVDALEDLMALAQKLNIDQRICFTGYLPFEKWMTLLSTVDICIEPAPANAINPISTMNKLMDYMALSKPVVAYDLPEHRVTAADSALYANPDDTHDLARLIASLVENPNLRKQLGAKGLARVEHGLAWSFQRERLLNTYDRLIHS
jgi:glycosyltransferase involved in cell wall biosynthesis